MSLADATQSKPFANGTEGEAWMSTWCEFCVHDHDMHDPARGGGCRIIADALMADMSAVRDVAWNGDRWQWPEAWLPEPDDGRFSLPSRLVCGMFEPCTEGACTGDPGADERAERVAEVTTYWIQRREPS